MEEIISFKNNFGHTLFGILHSPENSKQRPKIGINILNPGLKNRVAPNRLNVKLARALCDIGFYVLRFDPSGIGDSEGNFEGNNESTIYLWNRIQNGAFVDDTICSNNYFVSKADINKLILVGQCGGGVIAGLTGAIDSRVDSLILIDTPFRIIQENIDSSQAVVESFTLKKYLSEHFSNFFSFSFLNKIRSGTIDKQYIQKKIKHFKTILFQQFNKYRGLLHERFNYPLGDGLIQFLKYNEVHFIFAENDFSYREFESDFKHYFLSKKRIKNSNFTIDIVKDANHIYTETKWQDYLLNTIISSSILTK